MSALRLVAPGLLGLSVIVACGSDDDAAADSTVAASAAPGTTTAPETTAAPETTMSPETTEPGDEPRLLYNGVLQPGTYVGNQFEHPVTLTVGDGWQADEGFRYLGLYEVLADGVDPESAGGLALLDDAADLTIDEVIAEFEAVEGLSLSERGPTTIAGLDGVTFTVEPSVESINYFFLGNAQGWWYTPAGLRSEFHIVAAPTGTRVIVIEALPDQWETFRASAQSVIDTIVWAE